MSTKIQGQIVKEYLQKYPKLPSLTIARLINQDCPEVFNNLETARNCIRYYRGTSGKGNRKRINPDNIEIMKTTSPYERLGLPPSKQEYKKPWQPIIVEGKKILILSDIHLPFHDEEALGLAIEFGIKYKPDTIILNGDILDCHAISRWLKDPRLRNFSDERDAVLDFLQELRNLFPKCRIIWKLGNHEERYEVYMWTKAPELLDLDVMEFGRLMECDKYKIEVIQEKRPLRIANILTVMHGHEWPRGMMNPVNPARGFYMRAKDHVIGGHYHQPSEHSEKTIKQKIIGAWSTGCLCQLHPAYAPLNNWSHGFATVDVVGKEQFEVQLKKIMNGRVL